MRVERAWPAVLATVFLAAHLPFLAPALEDVDSANFVLGLRDFNPVLHQPHPPGYPFFIALGKLAQAAGLAPARALAVWGPIFGALAAFALAAIFRAIEAADEPCDSGVARSRPLWATTLALACPLYWFTAVRPMSDVPGLAVALVAQALLATAWWRLRAVPGTDRAALVASGRLIVLGALTAGLAMGLRAQTLWLTGPALLLVVAYRIGRDPAGALLGATTAFGIGTLLWTVPVLSASGGLRAYVAAIGSQAAEDISGVDMLVRTRTLPALLDGLLHTFVTPWDSTVLALVVIAWGMVGVVAMFRRSRPGLLLLTTLVLPYGLFHIAFQETITTRYALPLMPAMSYLAVRGLSVAGRRAVTVGAAVLVAWAVGRAAPATVLYARTPSPVAQALADLQAARRQGADPPLGMHFAFVRAAQANGGEIGPRLASPVGHEWLEVVRLWLRDGARTVWFLADPARTDLALIDPRSRTLRRSYRWSYRLSSLVSGVRPTSLDWWEFETPGWFLAEGWALTPETAGVARRDGRSPVRMPIAGYLLRRRPDSSGGEGQVMLIGGRNLLPDGGNNARVRVTVDGREVKRLEVPAGFFLALFRLPPVPDETPDGYAALEIAASADGAGPAGVAIEQFDVRPAGEVVWGFDRGWHEAEFDPSKGRVWRWMGDRADTIVHAPGRDLTLTMAGESPLRYFSRAPTVVIRVGRRELLRARLTDDFTLTTRIPHDVLAAAGGRVTVETDQTFVPAERSQSADRRRLGLRVWSVAISEATGP